MSPDDPLDEFFARERRAIEPQPTSPDHWASIVEEHRRARRVPAWRWVAGAAAAAAVVTALGLALRPGGVDEALPATSSTSSMSSTQATTSPTTSGSSTSVVTVTTTVQGSPTTATTPVTTGTRTGGPVLKQFDVVSLTNTGNGHRAALGTASCSGKPCSAVVTTVDAGAHWTLASSDATQVPGPDGPRAIRFASDTIGWLVGRDVRRTTDGGRTWTTYAHPGGYVFGLETDGRDVVIVAGDTPGPDGTTRLTVSRAPVGATSASAVGSPLQSSSFTGGDIVWNEHRAYVLPHGSDGTGTPLRVGANALTPLAPAPGRPPVAVASSASDGTIFSFGALGGAAGQMGFEVAASTDGGATWSDRTADDTKALLLANGGHTAFAATDAMHLVAVSGGSSDYHGSMKLSSDGGRSWHGPASAPPMPDRGWSWVGSPGDGIVYAVPVDPSGPYWWSADHGEHWQQAVLAG